MDHNNSTLTDVTSSQKTSKILYVFAWIIEVCAVITGLFISLMIGMDTYTRNTQIAEVSGQGVSVTNFANVFIAALPFVMVSVVELAKIPLAQALYVTKNLIWKVIFAFSLIFLAFITFETALNGFERNFNNLNYQVTIQKEKLHAANSRIELLSTKIEEASLLTRESIIGEFDHQHQLLSETKMQNMQTNKETMSLASSSLKDSHTEALYNELAGIKQRLVSATSDRNNEIKQVESIFKTGQENLSKERDEQRSELKRKVQFYEDRLRNAEDHRTTELNNAGFLSRSSVRSREDDNVQEAKDNLLTAQSKLDNISYNSMAISSSSNLHSQLDLVRNKHDSRISLLNDELSKKTREIAKVIGINKGDVDIERKRLSAERKQIEKIYNEGLRGIIEDRDSRLQTLTSKEEAIEKHQSEQNTLRDEVGIIRNSINAAASHNQIYRLAMMFEPEAKTAADVSKGMVDLVGKFWFGSLAMVIAITGIILALASLVTGDKTQTTEYSTKSRKGIIHYLRLLVIQLRKRRKDKPKIEVKEIIKEIPVDKVVFRDVVNEVIRKEVVHVPVYTSDPNLLGTQDVPK